MNQNNNSPVSLNEVLENYNERQNQKMIDNLKSKQKVAIPNKNSNFSFKQQKDSDSFDDSDGSEDLERFKLVLQKKLRAKNNKAKVLNRGNSN